MKGPSCPDHSRMCSTMPLPWCEIQKCLQTLSKVPWGGRQALKITPVKNHSSRVLNPTGCFNRFASFYSVESQRGRQGAGISPGDFCQAVPMQECSKNRQEGKTVNSFSSLGSQELASGAAWAVWGWHLQLERPPLCLTHLSNNLTCPYILSQYGEEQL